MNPTKKELARLERLAELITFPTTLAAAAADLGVTEAQCQRLMKKWPEEFERLKTAARRQHALDAKDEALRVLRTQMRSDKKPVRIAAAKVIEEQLGLPNEAYEDDEE